MTAGEESRAAAAARSTAAAAPSGLPLPWLGLVATLLLLLVHAWSYRFLCDDAYISFRYVRNLAHGEGLVFNPGFERVEGYSNFLWVLLLAGFEALGITAPRIAHILTLALTIGLWSLVIALTRRTLGTSQRWPSWLLLVPPLLLGATRSIAVWSTSGLETRLFELLVVAGVWRLLAELDAEDRASRPLPLAALLFALAALTRPDGALVGGLALAVGAAAQLRARRLASAARSLALFAAIVAAHYLFRRAYYGDWLPNTYYVKIGNRTRWDLGLEYLAAFLIEYGAALWLPLAVAGVIHLLRRGSRAALLPALYLAVVVPHAAYVAAIGGDHFEYRTLDLYFPFLYLLVAAGLGELMARGLPRALAALWLGAALWGVVETPLRSRQDWPPAYVAGFPGRIKNTPEADRWLRPERAWLHRLPGLAALNRRHRTMVDHLSRHGGAIRQEEHRAFLATVEDEGLRLKELVGAGRIQPRAHFAISAVGAIPYLSDLRILDRFGLTDRHVGHSPPAGFEVLAHEKRATLEYAREQGVDFWASDTVRSQFQVTEPPLIRYLFRRSGMGAPVHVAGTGPDRYLIGILPGGVEAARERLPGLSFLPAETPELRARIVAEAVLACKQRLRVAGEASTDAASLGPADLIQAISLGVTLGEVGESAAAHELLDAIGERHPSSPLLWLARAETSARAGDTAAAGRHAARAIELARTAGDLILAERIAGGPASGSAATDRP